MVFRGYFRFLLLPARGAYLDVSPSLAIYRLASFFYSLILCLFHYFSLFFTLDLRRRRHFVFFFSFCFIPMAFQHRGSSARTLSIRRNHLIASFPDGREECAASFLAEEISGPDHAIDFHAPTVKIFLSVFLTIPSFVASIGIDGNLNWIFRASIGDASILEHQF